MRFGIAETDQYLIVGFYDDSTPPDRVGGLSPTCQMKRLTDDWFWNPAAGPPAAWQAATYAIAMTAVDAVNMIGLYKVAKPVVAVHTQIVVDVDAGTDTVAFRQPFTVFEIDPKVDNLDAAITAVQTDIGNLNDLSGADVNAQADLALSDYDPPTKTELDAGFAALNDLSAAAVNTEVDTALSDYDPPTKTEMDNAFAALNDLSAAEVNTEVDSALNTAIPGSPTANSINERVAAIDDKLPTGTISDVTTAQVNTEADTALADYDGPTKAEMDVNLDAKVSTRAAASTALTNATWTDGKAAFLDASIAGVAAGVWAVGTRTLSSFGTLVADVATAVWGAVARTLTSGLANLDVAVSSRAPEAAGNVAAIKAKTDNLPGDPASEATLTALSAVAARALGLSFENSGEREVVWDADHRLTSSKTYLYDSAAHASVNDGITGVIAAYQMTISYGVGGFRDGWKVVKIT